MNSADFASMMRINPTLLTPLKVSDFSETAKARTLLLGFDMDMHTYHTYIFRDRIYFYVYDNKREYKFVDEIYNLNQIVPNRRLYPEFCDFEFCKFLKSRGVELTFTAFSETTHNLKRHSRYKGNIWRDDAFGNSKSGIVSEEELEEADA